MATEAGQISLVSALSADTRKATGENALSGSSQCTIPQGAVRAGDKASARGVPVAPEALFADLSGAELAAALAALDAGALPRDELVHAVAAWRRLASWVKARELALVNLLADRFVTDGRYGQSWREWLEAELSLGLTLTDWSASALVETAATLRDRLPGTMASLLAGALDEPRVRVITEGVKGLSEAACGRVEDAILERAPMLTTAQLRKLVAATVERVAAEEAAARRKASERSRRVEFRNDGQGTAEIFGLSLPAGPATAAYDRVDAIARAAKRAGDSRTTDQLRSDVFLALQLGLLTPGSSEVPNSAALATLNPDHDHDHVQSGSGRGSGVGNGPGSGVGNGAGSGASGQAVVFAGPLDEEGIPVQAPPADDADIPAPDEHHIVYEPDRQGLHDQRSKQAPPAMALPRKAPAGPAPGAEAEIKPCSGAEGERWSGTEGERWSGTEGERWSGTEGERWSGTGGGRWSKSGNARSGGTGDEGWSGSGGGHGDEGEGRPWPETRDGRCSGPEPEPGPRPEPRSGAGPEPGPLSEDGFQPSGWGGVPTPQGLLEAAARQLGGPHLVVGLDTLLGLAEKPGELGRYGSLVADIARQIADDSIHTGVKVCWTVTNDNGEAVHHGETRYRPGTVLRKLVNARDRTCRFPRCRRPASRCDLDHTLAHDQGGATCPCNLAPLCRRHHRLKQLDGWALIQPQPGLMAWITPSGRTHVVHPDTYDTYDVSDTG
ncbi:HNH endonuclease [Sphaerisporangium sp. NBC_01403]|uniref:HNH endonuclease signature motif containing protein n=1 Tax=Sphaerisporangium sp. NBC_01403 TaxID=2903599 RepID=UPI003247D1F4